MRRHQTYTSADFGSVSLLERRHADEFYNALIGRPRRRTATSVEDSEDTPTLTLSAAEVVVCVGGVNNATITATASGGGAVSWRLADATLASISAGGATATIKGKHPGVTTIEASVTSGGTTVKATARLLVVFVQLLLRNTGTIEPAPDNEDEASETTAAGGTNVLGPLPMGTGRGDPPFANASYISSILVIGRVFPAEAATRFTFRWQRLLSARSWRIRKAAARWNVTLRGTSGPLDDDTGSGDFNDPTPNTPGRRIYMYDNSGIFLGGETLAVGDAIHGKKDFIYRVWIRINGVWTICSAIHIGQIISTRRKANSGTVSADWTGIENTNAIRRVTLNIAEADVRALVGGSDPIDIAAGANP